MAIRYKVTVNMGTDTKMGVIANDDITMAEYKFLDQLADNGYTEADYVEVTTERTYERPTQPYGHESKCPCFECDAWAYDLIFWEQEELNAGRDPWAEFRI